MVSGRPIHLGCGEPVLLLHPFLSSQRVWQTVADFLAGTGRYEVFAPTLMGHHGGPPLSGWFPNPATLVAYLERQLDELGWPTAHIVGNSLGGLLAFNLERRGRARSVTAIAPAGGWSSRWSPLKFAVLGKGLIALPVVAVLARLAPGPLGVLVSHRMAGERISAADVIQLMDDVTHCPASYRMALSSLLLPGLTELASTAVPTQIVFCGNDKVIPASKFGRHFIASLPAETPVKWLEGAGHVPMVEDPHRIAELIADFIDQLKSAKQAVRETVS